MADPEEQLPAAVVEETKDDEPAPVPSSTPPEQSAVPLPAPIKPSSSGGIKRKLPSTTAAGGAKRPHVDGVGGVFSLFEPLPASSPLVDTFRDCLLAHFFPGRSSFPPSAQSSLPGPLPQSLSRRDLAQLEQGHYWVCEKSDGERAILLLHRSTRKAVLVDRAWSCRLMRAPHGELLTDLLAPHGDTVIDAELLEIERGVEDGREGGEDRERRGALYRVSMFDVVTVDGEDVSGRLFGGQWSTAGISDDSGRMDVILKRIQQPYKDHIKAARTDFTQAKAQQPPTSPPLPLPPTLELDNHFDLFTKTFVAKHHIDAILKNISHSPNPASPFFLHHVYRTSRGTNLNDGLIFTPDRASYHCREAPLLKWKWPDLNTVDFVVEAPFRGVGEKGLPLLCAGPVRDARKGSGGVRVEDVVFDHVKEVDEVSAGYLQEVARRGVERAVVECGYSRVDGEWHVKAVRWDKAKSNFLTTVVATVKAIMDDLQSNDIVAACKKNKFQYRRQT